ncbi:hypothetical protein BZZ01_16970 [Nostocales cyanobacterium HT-58-2]|nr:hypothetical protein BZZ01_16970 [Nostocales cyanobacterium HT-58-2]
MKNFPNYELWDFSKEAFARLLFICQSVNSLNKTSHSEKRVYIAFSSHPNTRGGGHKVDFISLEVECALFGLTEQLNESNAPLL